MRNLLLIALLASTAAPALADDRDDRRAAREAARAERSEARQERRAEPARQMEAPRPAEPLREYRAGPRAQAEIRSEPRMERMQSESPRAERREMREDSRGQVQEQALERRLMRERASGWQQRDAAQRPGREAGNDWAAPQAGERRQAADSVRDWRQDERQERRADRLASRGPRLVVPPPPYARPDRPAPAPAAASTYRPNHQRWDSSWRNDRRYDWHRYRDRNRWLFSFGAYYDPFGWNYRRHSIGWRMYPSYYSSSFWLDDPWSYRLPPAYGPYRWVRYWDDALLINIYTGHVVDVAHDFFW
jgi:hypothetical protein